MRLVLASAVAACIVTIPAVSLACACGCGVFDVQTGANLPNGKGGTVWAEYDFMNQNINWNGTHSAPSANNDDKIIRTHFITVGGQYMFNNQWGVTAQLPYWERYYRTTDEDSGAIVGAHDGSLGDIRLKGIYSGFDSSMASGITFGVKLPTGDYRDPHFDRDTEIGTGSTDLLLGAYHMGWVDKARAWGWFVNGELDQPVVTTAGYRPGSELDATGGVYYERWTTHDVTITPIAQVIASYRAEDRGPAADTDNSGYKRVLLSPGIEVSKGSSRLFASVALPVYQDVSGNQLTTGALFKVKLSRDF